MPNALFVALAIVTCSHFLAAVPSSVDLATVYEDAKSAEAAGDREKAIADYKIIVAARPDLAEAFANLGRLDYEARHPDEAVRALRKAATLKPGLAGPHFYLGVIAFERQNNTEAIAHLKTAIQAGPEDALSFQYLGFACYSSGQVREAARYFERAFQLGDTDPNLLYFMSKDYARLAEDFFSSLVNQYPQSPYRNLAWAHVREAQCQWEQAGDLYSKVLGALPASEGLRRKLDWIRAKILHPDEAGPPPRTDSLVDGSLAVVHFPPPPTEIPTLIKDLVKQAQPERTPRSPVSCSDRELYTLGETDQTLSYLTALMVIVNRPESYRAYELQAQMLEVGEHDDQALTAYGKALKIEPHDPDLHFAIGRLHWKYHHFASAAAATQQGLRLEPANALALFVLADSQLHLNQLPEAEQNFIRATKVDPSFAQAYVRLEGMYTAAGEYDKSLAELRKAMAADPSDPSTHYRSMVVMHKMGRDAEADEELKKFQLLSQKEKEKWHPILTDEAAHPWLAGANSSSSQH